MSTFAKHLAAIRSGEVAKSNVIGIRKAFNSFERTTRRLSTISGAIARRAIREI